MNQSGREKGALCSWKRYSQFTVTKCSSLPHDCVYSYEILQIWIKQFRILTKWVACYFLISILSMMNCITNSLCSYRKKSLFFYSNIPFVTWLMKFTNLKFYRKFQVDSVLIDNCINITHIFSQFYHNISLIHVNIDSFVVLLRCCLNSLWYREWLA